jgi:hypothetical protein
MAKIKSLTFTRYHVPNIKLEIEGEGLKNNRDLDEADQIKGEITVASLEEKQVFHEKKRDGDTIWHYEAAVRKHVHKITGLEEVKGPNGEKITDGDSLCDFPPHYLTNRLIQDFYFKIMGYHEDDIKPGADNGEFTQGEG